MVRPPLNDNGLKKGPWDPEEDRKLRNYIEEHGHGSWRSLPKRAGLNRCGKSCRLRWTNYLRPDIKRGDFSPQEQQIIIDLHATLGNKWVMIATRLPGRTDNEIKNFWNTHLSKKLLRDGIDPKTHQRISNFSNFLPNLTTNSLQSQLANISLRENILRFLNPNPLPPFLVESEILNRFHAASLGMLNPLSIENSGLLSGDLQSAPSDTSRPPEISQLVGNAAFCLPELIPATPEISSSSKDQNNIVYDYSPPVHNDEEGFVSKICGSSWEAAVADEEFWKDVFCESFLHPLSNSTHE